MENKVGLYCLGPEMQQVVRNLCYFYQHSCGACGNNSLTGVPDCSAGVSVGLWGCCTMRVAGVGGGHWNGKEEQERGLGRPPKKLL